MNVPPEMDKLSARIRELGEKSTQILLFLSFAFVAVVTLKSDHTISESQQHALTIAMRFWAAALLPIFAGIVPLKEFVKHEHRRYASICKWKAGFLRAATLLILAGAMYFGIGIWPAAHPSSGGAPGTIEYRSASAPFFAQRARGAVGPAFDVSASQSSPNPLRSRATPSAVLEAGCVLEFRRWRVEAGRTARQPRTAPTEQCSRRLPV